MIGRKSNQKVPAEPLGTLEFIVVPLPPTVLPGTVTVPAAIVDSPDSELEVAILGMFSFAARSIAELRRIIIVLVCGSINKRCSMLLLLLLLAVVPPILCWLCWFKLSLVNVDEDEDEDADSSFCAERGRGGGMGGRTCVFGTLTCGEIGMGPKSALFGKLPPSSPIAPPLPVLH
uniref:Uncharacterized protein n=1 Tax=Anopheles culicifacies TaxID=139723 RepID=A0A182M552_9DIPT